MLVVTGRANRLVFDQSPQRLFRTLAHSRDPSQVENELPASTIDKMLHDGSQLVVFLRTKLAAESYVDFVVSVMNVSVKSHDLPLFGVVTLVNQPLPRVAGSYT
jgi:hypothetical protein